MPDRADRGFFRTLSRFAVARLLLMGWPLLLGLGLTLAFHFEVALKQLAPGASHAATLGLCGGLLALYALLVRLFEGRWPAELSFRPALSWTGLGLAVGFGMVSAVYAIYAALGAVSWGGFNGLGGVADILVLAVVAGVAEELLFRGVLFRVLEGALGSALALIVSSAVFGLMHAGNPGATTFSTVAVALEAGGMLACAYCWSRSLWLPIALHAAWNFTLGGVYGAAVSGGEATSMLDTGLSGSELVTGGAFGPEASVVALVVCVSAGLVFLVAAVRRGTWRKATFRLLLDRGAPAHA